MVVNSSCGCATDVDVYHNERISPDVAFGSVN